MNKTADGDALAPPKMFESHVVKVQLPRGEVAQAFICNETRTIEMFAPPGLIAKRFSVGESTAFFKAELDSDGGLEIGDRVADRNW